MDTIQRRLNTRMLWLFGVCLLAVISGVLIWTDDRAYVLGAIPYLSLALCPLMHLFMHRGRGGAWGPSRRRELMNHPGRPADGFWKAVNQLVHETSSTELGRTEEERAYYRLSRRVYSVFAYVYDAVTFPLRSLRRAVVDAAELDAGDTVLDVATGTGAQAFAFAGSAGKVVGIDLSEAMLRVARKKERPPNLSFQQGDAARLPFADGSFDAACVSFALHEMPSSIRQRVLGEMARVIRPGGAFIVVDHGLPKRQPARSIVFYTVRLYEGDDYVEFMRSDLDTLLRAAGIEPEVHRTALRGLARIVVGRKARAATAHED